MSLLPDLSISVEPKIELIEQVVDNVIIEEAEVTYCEIYPADFLVESLAVEEVAPIAGEVVLASEALMTEEVIVAIEPIKEAVEPLVEIAIEEAEVVYCEIYPADFLVESLAVEEVAPIAGEVLLASEELVVEEVFESIEPTLEAVDPLIDSALEEPEAIYCEIYPADFLVESLAVEEIAPIAGEVLLASEALMTEEVFVAIEPTLEAVEPLIDSALEEPEVIYCEIYPADFLVESLAVEEIAPIAGEVVLASEALMTEEVFVAIEPTLEAVEPLVEIALEEAEAVYCEIYPADFLVESLAVEEVAPIAGEVLLASEALVVEEVFVAIEPIKEAVEPILELVEPLVPGTNYSQLFAAGSTAIGIGASLSYTDEVNQPSVLHTLGQNDELISEQPVFVWTTPITPIASINPALTALGVTAVMADAYQISQTTESNTVDFSQVSFIDQPIMASSEPISTDFVEVSPVEVTAPVDELMTTTVVEPVLVAIPDIIYQDDLVVVEPSIAEPVEAVVEAPVSDVVEIAPIEAAAPVDELMTTTVVDEPVLVAVPDIIYQDDLVVVEPSIAEPVKAVIETPVSEVVEVSPVEAAAPVDELMTITVVDEPVLVAVPDIIYQDDLVVVEPSIAESVEVVVEAPVSEVVEVFPVETATPVDELMTTTVVDEPVLVAIPDIIYQDDLVVVEPSIAEPVEAVVEAPVSDVVEVSPVETDVTVDEILTTTVVTSVEEPVLETAVDTPVLTVEPTVDESISILPILELAETSAGTANAEDTAVVSTEIDPPVVSIDDLLTTDDVVVPTVDEVITTAVGESAETPTPIVDEAVYDVPHGLQVTSELLLPTPVADTNHSPVSPRIHLDFMITTLNLF